MKIHGNNLVVFEVNEEQKEFLHELLEFCTYVKIQFAERDDEYHVAEMMREIASGMLNGKSFETHKN